jgi:integrase
MRPSSFPPKLQKFVNSVEKNAKKAGKSASRARIFGAWSACFVRYCTVNDRSWRDPSHVPAFIEYLTTEKDVSASSRERVAESLAFLFENLLKVDLEGAEWHPDHQPEPDDGQEDKAEQADESAKSSGEQSNLLTRLLFHTSLPISEAMELCAGDVDLDSGLIYVSDAMGTPKQIVELPEELYDPLETHLERLREKHGPRYFNAPLFQARALQGRVQDIDESDENGAADEDSKPEPAEKDPSERPASLWGYAEDE